MYIVYGVFYNKYSEQNNCGMVVHDYASFFALIVVISNIYKSI